MFGYVRLHKPEIKMGEYEQYRGVYCTLCRRLGARYGLAARLTLSYDMTFLALLHMALEPDDPDFCPGRCSFNPVKRCLRARNTRAIDRAADVGTLLSYYKLKDTVADEGLFRRLGARRLLLFAAPARRKAARRLPALDAAAASMMAQQADLEQHATASVDAAAQPFARLLETLATQGQDDPKVCRILSRLGYCLGRWIYLMDAVDDLPDDLQKGRYNPFAAACGISPEDGHGVQHTRQQAAATLNACLAEVLAAYDLLEVRRFDGILRNILEWGMPAAQRRVISGEERT